jgi:multiple sugar transport system substrate-binding protein
MTSDAEQTILNKTFGSLPTVQSAYGDAAFQTPTIKVIQQTLSSTAAPLPQVAQESQFETLVGTVMKNLFADAASGKPITADYVKGKLAAANQQVKAGG